MSRLLPMSSKTFPSPLLARLLRRRIPISTISHLRYASYKGDFQHLLVSNQRQQVQIRQPHLFCLSTPPSLHPRRLFSTSAADKLTDAQEGGERTNAPSGRIRREKASFEYEAEFPAEEIDEDLWGFGGDKEEGEFGPAKYTPLDIDDGRGGKKYRTHLKYENIQQASRASTSKQLSPPTTAKHMVAAAAADKPVANKKEMVVEDLATTVVELDDGKTLLVDVKENARGRYIKLSKLASSREQPIKRSRITLSMGLAKACVNKLQKFIENEPTHLPASVNQPIYSARLVSEHRVLYLNLMPNKHSVDGLAAEPVLRITTVDDVSKKRLSLVIGAGDMPKLRNVLESHLLDYGGDEEEMASQEAKTLKLHRRTIRLEPGDESLKIGETAFHKDKSLHSAVHIPYPALPRFVEIIGSYARPPPKKDGGENKHNSSDGGDAENSGMIPKLEAHSLKLDRKVVDFHPSDELQMLKITETYFHNGARTHSAMILIQLDALGKFGDALAEILRDYEDVKRKSRSAGGESGMKCMEQEMEMVMGTPSPDSYPTREVSSQQHETNVVEGDDDGGDKTESVDEKKCG